MNPEIILVELVYMLATILKLPFESSLKFFGPLSVTLLAFSVVTVILIHPWWLVLLLVAVWTGVVRHLRTLHRQHRGGTEPALNSSWQGTHGLC